MDTDHETLRESAGLYVLGTLTGDARRAFEAHVEVCAECAGEVRALAEVVRTLPWAVPQIDPPPTLRNRVLSAIGAPHLNARAESIETRRRSRLSVNSVGWLAAAAMLAAAVALGAYASALRGRLGDMERQLDSALARLAQNEQQLAAATRASAGMQLRIAVLTAPDLRQVDLRGQAPAPRATGRAFWSRTRGLVFAASELPPLPVGRTYQLWYLTTAAPVSAGLVAPDDSGRVAAAFEGSTNTPTPVGLAVSIEPEGGVLAPTGAIYLAGTTQ